MNYLHRFKSAKRQELNEIMEEREKLAREKEARVAARNAALQVQESA